LNDGDSVKLIFLKVGRLMPLFPSVIYCCYI